MPRNTSRPQMGSPSKVDIGLMEDFTKMLRDIETSRKVRTTVRLDRSEQTGVVRLEILSYVQEHATAPRVVARYATSWPSSKPQSLAGALFEAGVQLDRLTPSTELLPPDEVAEGA